jgi:hypothetical protein
MSETRGFYIWKRQPLRAFSPLVTGKPMVADLQALVSMTTQAEQRIWLSIRRSGPTLSYRRAAIYMPVQSLAAREEEIGVGEQVVAGCAKSRPARNAFSALGRLLPI